MQGPHSKKWTHKMCRKRIHLNKQKIKRNVLKKICFAKIEDIFN